MPADRPWPSMGCGIGLRSPHYPVITERWPAVDWFEAISENYMDSGGRPVQILEKIRGRYPIALHGTALSIGSADPLNQTYLSRLKALADRIDPFIVSDHLCWSGVDGEVLHDLLPLPFTEESVRHIVLRVQEIQERLGRRILLENVSTYVTFRHSTMAEWDFLKAVAARSGCGILLDLNNIYVNSVNHGFDPYEYLAAIPGESIGQFHLAGHTDMGAYLFDTHSAPVIDAVWDLYRDAIARWGKISTLIEWDEDIPPFERLQEEAARARRIYEAPPAAPRKPGTRIAAAPRIVPMAAPDVSLKDAQHWFKERIQPGAVPAAAQTILNPQGGAAGEERVAVYAGGYVSRIHEAVEEVFEAVARVLGHEAFDALSRGYVETFPSKHYNLNETGKNLPDFIRSTPLAKEIPFLHDLARLEWQVWQAFHAFDAAPALPADLAAVPAEAWDRAVVRFQPSVSLLASEWPVLNMWLARKEESPKNELFDRAAQRILIGRKGEQVRCELLDEVQYRFVEELFSGRSLGEACEALAQSGSEDIPVTAWFARWMNDGLIASVQFG